MEDHGLHRLAARLVGVYPKVYGQSRSERVTLDRLAAGSLNYSSGSVGSPSGATGPWRRADDLAVVRATYA